jgi:RimJ/RimL family protein N-acetyltransferase
MDFELRDWELADAPSLAAHANNACIWENVRDNFPFPYTEASGEFFIRLAQCNTEPETEKAIVVNGKAVGSIGISRQDDVERVSAELGYWIGEAFWNKGIMTEAVKRMVDYAFENFTLHKIYAKVFGFNGASKAVLEKAGFSCEAILRQAALNNDVLTDLYYYVIFNRKRFLVVDYDELW